jgi:hypothetical protein
MDKRSTQEHEVCEYWSFQLDSFTCYLKYGPGAVKAYDNYVAGKKNCPRSWSKYFSCCTQYDSFLMNFLESNLDVHFNGVVFAFKSCCQKPWHAYVPCEIVSISLNDSGERLLANSFWHVDMCLFDVTWEHEVCTSERPKPEFDFQPKAEISREMQLAKKPPNLHQKKGIKLLKTDLKGWLRWVFGVAELATKVVKMDGSADRKAQYN